MGKTRDTYSGGFERLLKRASGRSQHYAGAEAFLGAVTTDFQHLSQQTVEITGQPGEKLLTIQDKLHELEAEFQGQSSLLLLHALVIAILRRDAPPAKAQQMFLELWRTHSDFLLTHHTNRWILSALTTFADHGATESQRRLGNGITILWGTMKFYEAERSFTGQPLDQPSDGKPQKRQNLGVDMGRYSLTKGDLDRNVLLRLWKDAQADPIAGPAALKLLNDLNADDRNVFRRMQLLRKRKQRRRNTR
ncbi:hypothetical protein [Algirhabdus cladophorae]|uniref:hypothetical protein n=1 Tax=Algirhabdus cladophorae TaxID=3377108 RepID=UPI003B84A465